jgi:hypothetical protein
MQGVGATNETPSPEPSPALRERKSFARALLEALIRD